MENAETVIKTVLNNKVVLRLNDNKIFKHRLLKSYVEYLSLTIGKNDHNVGAVMHLDSPWFNALTVVCAVINNILCNEASPEAIVNSLLKDDIVLYYEKDKTGLKPERYKFEKITKINSFGRTEKGPFALIRQYNEDETDETCFYVPKQLWPRIVPYNGDSLKLDGSGIRKETILREIFLSEVLGMNKEAISRKIDSSTVIIMPREEANNLVEGLELCFSVDYTKLPESFRENMQKGLGIPGEIVDLRMPLTDLVHVSYYSEDLNEYQYGRNPAKTDSVIKIASKASTARKLLKNKDNNRNIGLIVFGEETIRNCMTELPELLNVPSLHYALVSSNISSMFIPTFLESVNNVRLFACTKEYLCSIGDPYTEKTKEVIYTRFPEYKKIVDQISNTLDHSVKRIISSGPISTDEYYNFKRTLFKIKSSDYISDEKDKFVMQAFSLMNLYSTIVCSTNVLDICININPAITVKKVAVKLKELNEIIVSLPSGLRVHALEIWNILNKLNESLCKTSPKGTALRNLLIDYRNKKITLIVPKMYYKEVILHLFSNSESLYITTANKYKPGYETDVIIAIGNILGTSVPSQSSLQLKAL